MNLYAVILAAGLGKRMKSDTPKVLHEVLGRPMLQHVIDAVKQLKPVKSVVVIGNGAEQVKEKIGGEGLSFVLQKKLLGTGDAVAAARDQLKTGTALILNGDGPLITTQTLKTFLSRHKRNKNTLSFLSFTDDSLSGYGRVFRDASGRVTEIVEDKHASDKEKRTFNELNGGVYLIETKALRHLADIKRNSASGEYYLTDLVGILSRSGSRVDAYNCPPEDIRGVNSRQELFEVSDILRKRIIWGWMDRGVTFINPHTTVVHTTASIGKDTILYPNTIVEGTTSIGRNCVIHAGARIADSFLGNEVTVKDSTLIEKSRIGKGTSVGPFAHLRPESIIGKNAKIGNFVEIKKSNLGDGTKASHLSYLGDAQVGSFEQILSQGYSSAVILSS